MKTQCGFVQVQRDPKMPVHLLKTFQTESLFSSVIFASLFKFSLR